MDPEKENIEAWRICSDGVTASLCLRCHSWWWLVTKSHVACRLLLEKHAGLRTLLYGIRLHRGGLSHRNSNNWCFVCIACGRLGATISSLVYEQLLVLTGNFTCFFFVLAGAALIIVFLTDFLPYETLNQSLSNSLPNMKEPSAYGAMEKARDRDRLA